MTAPLTHKKLLDFIKNQKIMEGLTEAELAEMLPYLEIISFDPGKSIFEEGDHSSEIYFIFDGEVSLLKNDEQKKSQYLIGKLKQGNIFGEMSFLDNSPRSCTIKTNHHLILVKLSREGFEQQQGLSKQMYSHIIRNIAIVMIDRLREANKMAMNSSNSEIKKLLILSEFARLFINLFVVLLIACGISGFFYINFGKYFFAFNWITLAILFSVIYYFARQHNVSMKKFGFEWKGNATFSFVKAIALSIGGVILLLFYNEILKYFHFSQSFSEYPPLVYLLTYPLYAFWIEFVFRGVMQTSLQKFLLSSSPRAAVIYTALIVAGNNFYFGFNTAICAFLLNLICGFTYLSQKNLYASTLCHIIVYFFLIGSGLIYFAHLF